MKQIISKFLQQKIEARNEKSLVYIYFNEFHKQKDYCVDVKAIKAFEVKEPLNAGVKVYDFEEKGKKMDICLKNY